MNTFTITTADLQLTVKLSVLPSNCYTFLTKKSTIKYLLLIRTCFYYITAARHAFKTRI